MVKKKAKKTRKKKKTAKKSKRVTVKSVKEIRKRMGLNQTQFGKKVGVGLQTVSNWESGRSKPRAKVLARIAKLA